MWGQFIWSSSIPQYSFFKRPLDFYRATFPVIGKLGTRNIDGNVVDDQSDTFRFIKRRWGVIDNLNKDWNTTRHCKSKKTLQVVICQIFSLPKLVSKEPTDYTSDWVYKIHVTIGNSDMHFNFQAMVEANLSPPSQLESNIFTVISMFSRKLINLQRKQGTLT